MKLADCFTRDNPRKVISLKDEHRDGWLKDAIYAAHNGQLPDDWVYEECYAACEAIDESSLTAEDGIHDFADSRVDVYTSVRFHWAADHCLSTLFADAEAEAVDLGGADDEAVSDLLGRIQYCAIARIAQTMLSAYEENGADETETTKEVSP